MRHEFREKECAVFRKHALIEDQEELASVWPQALDRMRKAGREIPRSPLLTSSIKIVPSGFSSVTRAFP